MAASACAVRQTAALCHQLPSGGPQPPLAEVASFGATAGGPASGQLAKHVETLASLYEEKCKTAHREALYSARCLARLQRAVQQAQRGGRPEPPPALPLELRASLPYVGHAASAAIVLQLLELLQLLAAAFPAAAAAALHGSGAHEELLAANMRPEAPAAERAAAAAVLATLAQHGGGGGFGIELAARATTAVRAAATAAHLLPAGRPVPELELLLLLQCLQGDGPGGLPWPAVVAAALLAVLQDVVQAGAQGSAAVAGAVLLPCLRALAELAQQGAVQKLDQQQQEQQQEEQQAASVSGQPEQECEAARPAVLPSQALQQVVLQLLLTSASAAVAAQAAALLQQLLPQPAARLAALAAHMPDACSAGQAAVCHFVPLLVSDVRHADFDFGACGGALLLAAAAQQLLHLAQQLAGSEGSDQVLLASLAPESAGSSGGTVSEDGARLPSPSAAVGQLAALLGALLAAPGAVAHLAQAPALLRDFVLALATLQSLGAAATPGTVAAQQQLLEALSSQVSTGGCGLRTAWCCVVLHCRVCCRV